MPKGAGVPPIDTLSMVRADNTPLSLLIWMLWLYEPLMMLYAMMAVAAWLVWRADAPAGKKNAALSLFAVQLALNALWSFVFFGWHQIGWALVEIIAMWLAIVATAVAFFEISKPAAWLLVPYLAWVSFATVLTFTIWRLNA